MSCKLKLDAEIDVILNQDLEITPVLTLDNISIDAKSTTLKKVLVSSLEWYSIAGTKRFPPQYQRDMERMALEIEKLSAWFSNQVYNRSKPVDDQPT
jgi:hypothetical protein